MSDLIARRYSHSLVGNIEVCQVLFPIVTSTRTNPRPTIVFSSTHFIKSASFRGSVIKYQDHFSPWYRQSTDEKGIVVDILFHEFREFPYCIHISRGHIFIDGRSDECIHTTFTIVFTAEIPYECTLDIDKRIYIIICFYEFYAFFAIVLLPEKYNIRFL